MRRKQVSAMDILALENHYRIKSCPYMISNSVLLTHRTRSPLPTGEGSFVQAPLSAHRRETYIKPVGATITPLRYVSRTSSCWSSARAQSNSKSLPPRGRWHFRKKMTEGDCATKEFYQILLSTHSPSVATATAPSEQNG